jgi:hypothetical protein
VDVKRGGMPPLEIRLSPGTVVRAKVTAPSWVPSNMRARLVPRRHKSDIGGMPSAPIAEELATRPAICWPSPGGGGEVGIPLGAGCITGKIPALKDNYWRLVEVTAVAKANHALTRQARCDNDGNFCVRYLSPGT